MFRGERLALIIPALNEEQSVGDVVRDFRALTIEAGAPLLDHVVVGDNGSRDRTAEVAVAAGAKVVSEPRRGYGYACLAAIGSLPPEVSILVFADADRSDDPSELPSLLAPIAAGADLVIGSRALGKAEPGSLTPQQVFGNWLSAFLIRLIWRHPITDLGPFRVIRRSAYDRVGMEDKTYGWTVEMQVKAIQQGMRVEEVPVSYRRRVGVSKVSGTISGTIGAGTKILGMIAWLWIRGMPARSRLALLAFVLLLAAVFSWAAWAGPKLSRSMCCSASPSSMESDRAAGVLPLRGIALGLHEGDAYDYRVVIDEIAEMGAGAIEFAIPYYQEDVRSNHPGPKARRTPSARTIASTIRHARARGMKVMLLPIVLLDHADTKEWRGVMTPSDTGEWWSEYGRTIADLARVAESEDVEGLSVGSELHWSENMRDRWTSLIHDVRGIYSGTLLYSANWDHYEPVTFWDKLDAVGVSGYFELTKDSEASVDALRSAWIEKRDQLLAWRSGIGKPIIFTEIGYPAIDGGAVFPWNYTLHARPDEDEQRRALTAFFEASRDAPGIEGAFLYEWGIHDRGGSLYSPRRRAAESTVRKWLAER
jgi:hypothetical protein